MSKNNVELCYRRWRILHLHGVVVLVGLVGLIGRHIKQKTVHNNFNKTEETYLLQKDQVDRSVSQKVDLK